MAVPQSLPQRDGASTERGGGCGRRPASKAGGGWARGTEEEEEEGRAVAAGARRRRQRLIAQLAAQPNSYEEMGESEYCVRLSSARRPLQRYID